MRFVERHFFTYSNVTFDWQEFKTYQHKGLFDSTEQTSIISHECCNKNGKSLSRVHKPKKTLKFTFE